MKKYLFILILYSCNSGERANTIEIPDITYDSVLAEADSLTFKLRNIDSSITSSVNMMNRKIEKLTDEKIELQKKIDKKIVPKTIDVSDLLEKISKYQREIAYLKNKIYQDSLYRANLYKSKPQIIIEKVELYMEKPDKNSLIIEFDRKIDGGEIPLQGIEAYIIPYSKKLKKLMLYEVSCNRSEINRYDGKQLSYYNGQYFVNGVSPGKYLIKVCYYYGNFQIIDRSDGYQVINLKVSPPIQ